jgi:hypothetical protein
LLLSGLGNPGGGSVNPTGTANMRYPWLRHTRGGTEGDGVVRVEDASQLAGSVGHVRNEGWDRDGPRSDA